MVLFQSLRGIAVLALILALDGCRTTRTDEPAGMQLAKAEQLEPARAWRVLDGGELRGVVVQFEMAEDPTAPAHHYYSVRNVLEQELGSIDAQGRAWRFEVHQRDAHLVTTGTLLDGARAILGLGASAQLVEGPLETLRGKPAKR